MVMEIIEDYKKYRWFITSSGKTVVGGKSAGQNENLLRKIEKSKDKYFVMHTSHPGSPFSVILSNIINVTKNDLEECAIFTGAFSRAWKEGKKKTYVHIFLSTQLRKEKNMKSGTWNVVGKVDEILVGLELILIKQKKTYRAVSEKTAGKKKGIKICPGRIDKEEMAKILIIVLKEKEEKKNEILSALPAGGFRIYKTI